MASVTIEAFLETEMPFLMIFQDEDIPFDSPSSCAGPLQYWAGHPTGFAVSKPEDVEKLTVTFSLDPDDVVSDAQSFVFVQEDSGAFIGYATNDVYVNILSPGSYHVRGEQDPADPAHIHVRFTRAQK